ncbi:flavodoxin family protein [Methanomicrobium antiquum]|uniref:Flavodoxin family protein n=1 Tax=Methanomicrobium antiquum TaxID=487686 RepID=A0AAF0JTW5_9EURY|nr:NAD(P)H-dependent oxidoreductase [Methanomicrobium antiquum]WFN36868.1 flavodoxin family protein [Methanomicrobium antiquum]
MKIKVLGFATSPRRHGNSEDLLEFLLEAMSNESDVITEKIALSDYDVKPCRGCNACEKKGVCVIKDDMPALLEKIKEADIVVLSAPIYCMSVCSQAKALIDRMQVFRSIKYVLKKPVVPPENKGKRMGIFLSTAGQDWDTVFDAAIPVVKCFFHLCEITEKNTEYLMINSVDKKGEIKKHSDAKILAEKLGKDAILKIRDLKVK